MGIFDLEIIKSTMEVSRSGYYKWIKRKDTLNRYQNDRAILSNMIVEIYEKHRTWGYRHIAAYIRKEIGWVFSDNLCHKCCRALKIRSKARKPPYKQGGEEHIIYPNVIHNDWSTERPLEKVCTDTTIFYNNNKAYDLTMYIDGFDTRIRFSRKKETALEFDDIISKHNEAVIKEYEVEIIDDEIWITEKVNNLIFRNNKKM